MSMFFFSFPLELQVPLELKSADTKHFNFFQLSVIDPLEVIH